MILMMRQWIWRAEALICCSGSCLGVRWAWHLHSLERWKCNSLGFLWSESCLKKPARIFFSLACWCKGIIVKLQKTYGLILFQIAFSTHSASVLPSKFECIVWNVLFRRSTWTRLSCVVCKIATSRQNLTFTHMNCWNCCMSCSGISCPHGRSDSVKYAHCAFLWCRYWH